MDSKEKAALLFSLIGDHLPKEVLDQFSKKELEQLMKGMNALKKPTLVEERSVLSSLSGKKPAVKKTQKLFSNENPVYEEKYSSTHDKGSPLAELKNKKREELEMVIKDEVPRTIAMVMCFANPDEASGLIEDLPEKVREEIIHEIHKIDFYSEKLRSELESFLSFKYDLIESRLIVSKVKNRSSKTVADILSRISPNLSFKLFSSIKESNPEFAETINEHFYTIQDLLFVGRTSLSKFFSGFHPIVLACALKGVETDLKLKILDRCEPWITKQINLEMDSMGPVSLAEIEEAQKAIIEGLNQAVDTGKIKLWKVK